MIARFSEDIDIRIEPPESLDVKIGRNQDKPAHCESRKYFYDWLASAIQIDGIQDIQRDTAFDDGKYRSGGIRLYYKNLGGQLSGLKDGILLEVGFDDITPNLPRTISSWAYDYAVDKVDVIDNRAVDVACYAPGYTLVEKLQTISTKYRQQQDTRTIPSNFMRHYYDVYCLLRDVETLRFIGTSEYQMHKAKRFRIADHPIIAENEAFLLRDKATRATYKAAYESTSALYYQSQPNFEEILATIQEHIHDL